MSSFLPFSLCLFFRSIGGSVPLHLPLLCFNVTRICHHSNVVYCLFSFFLLFYFFHNTTWGGTQDGQHPQAPLHMTQATHASAALHTTHASAALHTTHMGATPHTTHADTVPCTTRVSATLHVTWVGAAHSTEILYIVTNVNKSIVYHGVNLFMQVISD